jgi:multidrug efflux pump
MAIGTVFTLFVVPAMYMILGAEHAKRTTPETEETLTPPH